MINYVRLKFMNTELDLNWKYRLCSLLIILI